MWLRLCTIKLLRNLKVLPQNSQDLALPTWFSGGEELHLDGTDGSCEGVVRKGRGLEPGWNRVGLRSRCMGGTRLGERGGVGPPLLLLPANSRRRWEKPMDGSMPMGVSRITRSKALGCWDRRPISSGPRRSRGWRGGGGLTKGGVDGNRVSMYPGGGGSRSSGAPIRNRWKGLLPSPRKLARGERGKASAPSGGGRAMRGVSEQLEGCVSR